MALRNIMRHPNDDVLKKKSRKVNIVNDRTLILLEDMAETMYAANGAGLAAVQVGKIGRAHV